MLLISDIDIYIAPNRGKLIENSSGRMHNLTGFVNSIASVLYCRIKSPKVCCSA